MNPAALAILEELLAVSQATNVNLLRILGAGGGSSAGAGAGALGSIAKAAGPVGLALGAVASAGGLLKASFNGLWDAAAKLKDGIVATVGALYSFSLQAQIGAAKLSDFYASFKQLPFFIGELFGVLSDLTKVQEVLLDNYQKMSQSGASFSGSLSQLQQQAARSYLTLDQFSKVVIENSQVFATMGGNVQSGINKFVQVQNQMMGPNSPYARQILGMGFTFEEAGGLIASYMRSQGTMNKESLQNNNTVIQGTMEYARQLDTLSKLTGKRREQIEKEVKEIEEEESWQQYLAALPADAAAAAKTALTQAQQIGGKDFATSMRLAIQTGITTPLTDEGKNFSVTSRGTREAYLATIAEAVRNGRKSNEVSALGFQSSQMLINANKQTFQSMGSLTGILGVTNSAFVKGMNTVLAYDRTVGNQDKALQKITQQQQEQARGSAEAMARSELAARQFGLELLGLISSAIQPLMPMLKSLAKAIGEGVTALLKNDGFLSAIKSVATWITTTFSKLASSKNAEDFWTNMASAIKSAVSGAGAMLSSLWESVRPYLIYAVKASADYLGTKMAAYLNPFSDESLQSKAQERKAAYEKELQDLISKGANASVIEAKRRDVDRESATISMYQKDIDAKEEALRKREDRYLEDMNRQLRSNELGNRAGAGRGLVNPGRQFGTAEVLGRLTEPEDTVTQIHAGERVLNPQEAADYNNLSAQVAVLNNTTAQLLQAMKQTAENTRRTYDATKSLNGNVLHQLA
jgi:hypothetical protein